MQLLKLTYSCFFLHTYNFSLALSNKVVVTLQYLCDGGQALLTRLYNKTKKSSDTEESKLTGKVRNNQSGSLSERGIQHACRNFVHADHEITDVSFIYHEMQF